MKRSRSIELALMSTVPLLLSACDASAPAAHAAAPGNALAYENLQQCVSSGQVSPEVCARAYADALEAQMRTAPRFDSLAECEARFGYDQCRAAPGGSGHWFMPALAGFMIGQALAHHDARPGYWGPYPGYGSYGYGGYAGQPIYRARGDRGEWQTADGGRFGWGARGPAAPSVGETLSRGGFGMTSAARGSWGG
jgi:uncharacterized protein YgiB involved in biofilm formation